MDENRERERERERESSTARNEANKEGLIVSGIVKWARVGLGEESSGHRGHILRVHAFYSKSTIVLWVSHTHKPVVGSRSSLHARTHCVHHSTHTHKRAHARSRGYGHGRESIGLAHNRSWGWSLDLIKSSKFIYSLLSSKYYPRYFGFILVVLEKTKDECTLLIYFSTSFSFQI